MSLLRRPDICPRSSLPKAETPEEQDAFSVFVHVLYSVDNPKPVRVFKYLTRAEVRFQNRIIASLDEWKAIQEELIYIGYSVTEQAFPFPGWSVGHEVFSIDISIPENCKPLPFDWNGRFRPAYDIQHDRDEFQRIQARENYVQCFLPALYSGKSFAVRCMDNKFVEMPSTIWRPIATLKEWEDDITLEIRDAGYSVKGTGAMHHYIVNASEEGMEATSRQ